MSQSLKLAKQLAKDMEEDVDFIESNEFVGAAAAAKVAGKDEFEFNGKTYPVEISQETAEKIMSQALDLAKDLAKAKKEESIEIEEAKVSLQNSLKVLSKAGIGARVTDMEKLAQAIHKNYKAITGEKYQDADQVAMSEPIANLIGHFRINGDKFISTWDKTIKEETEISEATEFVKGDRVMDVRTKLKGTVLHKGNKDEVYVDLGAIKKAISSKDLRLVEAAEQLDEDTEELEESEHGEWFTCEIHVKSSGQLYSTFYVQARDMGEAKKKADKVFKELMKTTYPKDWPSYSKKFTVKVMKGDNIGDLMP